MKILYAIQGTGNGHITVAREVIPYLLDRGEVDILISGTEVEIDLPYNIRYRLHGMSFVFGKNGGIDYLETFKKSRIKRLFREIQQLPVEDYDLVISDFEPVSAWACYLKNKECIGFSHQAAVVSKYAPKAEKKDRLGRAVLKYYAPTSHSYGFHFQAYDEMINTPIIRTEIRDRVERMMGAASKSGNDSVDVSTLTSTLPLTSTSHYTVYLPSYSDKRVVKFLNLFPEIRWEVFSKRLRQTVELGHIIVRPLDNTGFIESMAGCEGVFCNAGFQTPAEALFLNKKLLVMPMKGQYEQQCNAAALSQMGVRIMKNLKLKREVEFREWLLDDGRVSVHFPDVTEALIDMILTKHANTQSAHTTSTELKGTARFRELLLKKMF